MVLRLALHVVIRAVCDSRESEGGECDRRKGRWVILCPFLALLLLSRFFCYAWLLVCPGCAKVSLINLQFSLGPLRGEAREALASVWLMLA